MSETDQPGDVISSIADAETQATIAEPVSAEKVEVKVHPESAATPGFELGKYFALSEDLEAIGVSQSFLAPVQRPASPQPFHRFSIGLSVAGKVESIPLGLSVMSGGTGAGKSDLTRALVARNPSFERVISAEAYDSEDEIDTVPAFDNATGALAYAVAEQIKDKRKLVIIDSLRAPVFETNGPAGEKGVIMPFLTQITRVSNALARQGRTVVAIVNPMNDNPEYVERFLGYLSSALPCYIYLKGRSGGDLSRVYEGSVTVRAAGKPYHRQPRPFIISDTTKSGASKRAVGQASFPKAEDKNLSLADRAISKLV